VARVSEAIALRKERDVTETECKELLDHELDTVTGGLVVPAIIQPVIALGGIGPSRPANADAMAAWNNLLRQNGF
jgi:hypothetical protein